MERTRIWINFSKEYKKEYDKAIKEGNVSRLVCELLRSYYKENDKSENELQNKIDEIYGMLNSIINGEIIINRDINKEDDDFTIW